MANKLNSVEARLLSKLETIETQFEEFRKKVMLDLLENNKWRKENEETKFRLQQLQCVMAAVARFLFCHQQSPRIWTDMARLSFFFPQLPPVPSRSCYRLHQPAAI
ncbi:unnamed protein product [Penicillium egyptiacum]|uniref:Uncharacterized protein n=1 Tax=Penicillium egyptiacum TaxID=1303716 RepID=A0A9W4K1T2_9EURO|nr:unnamed protein product [Penicillium egyptiacum]